MTHVRALRSFALAAVLASSVHQAEAKSTGWVGDSRAAVRLVTASDSTNGAARVEAGLEFRYAPGWHGYWRTPGDAGIAPVLDWSGSQHLKDAAVSWPAPMRLVVSGLQNSIYTGQFILPVSLKLREEPKAATQLRLAIDYAACANICVPEHADLSLDLPLGQGGASDEAPAIAAARAAVPGPPAAAGIEVLRATITRTNGATQLVSELQSRGEPFGHPDLFVEGAGDGLPAAPLVQLSDDKRVATLTTSLPDTLDRDTLTLTVVDAGRSATFPVPRSGPAAQGSERGLLATLLIAVLGGLILNLMPCVLPILSIKLFGLARNAGAERRALRLGFVATALGIVTCFLALASVLVGLKLSGATLGWGIQFQQPWFLAALAVLTVLFAASFFEWLPIGMPRVLAGLAGTPSRGALVEAFLAGAFSTLLATPCSAPFVGTAVGFALAGTPWDIVAIFLCLGLGMALPFLAAALYPGVVAWLPRPGRWMLQLRRVLGLLLLGTAAWLVFVLASVAGAAAAGAVALLLATLLVFRAWATRQGAGGEHAWRGIATASIAALAIGAAWLPASSQAGRQNEAESWQAFDPEAIDRLVAGGSTVLVDVTASWCLTCKVNDLTTLNAPELRARLAQPGTIRMRADWSRPNPRIAAYLQRFARFGIPLDVVYGPNTSKGEALPELLTTGAVIAALDRAGTGAGAPPSGPS